MDHKHINVTDHCQQVHNGQLKTQTIDTTCQISDLRLMGTNQITPCLGFVNTVCFFSFK